MPLPGQIALPPLTALLDLTTQKQCKPPADTPLIHISDPCRHLHQDDGLRTPTFSNRHASGYGQIHFPWLENTGGSTPVFSSSSPPEHDPTKAEEGSDDQVIFVKEFTFLGNTVFSDAELAGALAPFTHRAIPFEALTDAQKTITDLYVNHGYVTSGAYLPLQPNQSLDPRQAEIAIQIKEGAIEEITVTGSPRLRSYVQNRLQVATSPVFNQGRLEEALRLLQLDPSVETISATLLPGASDSESILQVEAISTPVVTLHARANDFRSPGVGPFERSAGLELRNATGLGERLSLDFSNTDGSSSLRLDASVPINPHNGELFFQYGDFQGRILSAPFREFFDIRVDSSTYAAGVRQPIRQSISLVDGDPRREFLSLSATLERTDSLSTVDGQPTPLSPGANRLGRTGILTAVLSQDYLYEAPGQALALRSSVGIGFNDNPVADFQDFVVFSGHVAFRQTIGPTSLLLTGRAQLSLDPLIPIQQVGLGGPGSVLGFERDALLSDNALVASAELHIPLVQAGDLQIRAIPFANGGRGWNQGAERRLERNTLAAVGAGLQIDWGPLGGRINYAIPLTEGPRDPLSFELFLRYGL